MRTLTVTLADEDVAFLERLSADQGTSAEDFLAQQAHSLVKLLQRPLSPEVLNASGTLLPDIDAMATYRQHLELKYL
jgi:uncharacterized protein involved in type VI secretion and phage assembly